MDEINKYLTEAMGECWHEWTPAYINEGAQSLNTYRCTKPECKLYDSDNGVWKRQNNFFTWDGFSKLWEWAIKQEWFWSGDNCFTDIQINQNICGAIGHIPYHIINPTNFANAIYKYLKGR